MEIEKTVGQAYLFEIRITFNGELVIKCISHNPQILERTSETSTATTPEKTMETQRSMHTIGKMMFISQSEKRSKR